MRYKWLTIFFCILAVIIQIYFRYQLSINRYFDVDEFAHLHWAYSFISGAMPYRDFFYIFPPYFLFPVGAIISIFGRSAATLIYVRGFIFAVQIISYLVLFLWAKKLRNTLTAFLTLVIFIFLPLPSDKLLEIRPDLLATVLALLGLYIFVTAYENKKSVYFLLSGFLLSASLAFVPKTIFFLIPVAAVFLYQFLTLKKERRGKFGKNYLYMASGFAVNLIIVAIIYLASGKFWQALYLTTKLAGDVTKILALKFYMRPDIFFYPNDTYYGMPGVSMTLIANLVIYFLGFVWGIKQMVSSLSHNDDNRNVREFVFASCLMVNLFAFVKIYPLKHLQYLIPVSFFVAFYFADLMIEILDKLKNKGLAAVLFLIAAGYMTYLSYLMFQYKVHWVNTQTLTNLSKILKEFPQKTAIFDLTGETVFYPDGYYFCCLPYGQYEEKLNFAYPKLESDLMKRGTQYVHIGKTDRLGVLPIVHAKYIRENFKSDPANGELNLWKRSQ